MLLMKLPNHVEFGMDENVLVMIVRQYLQEFGVQYPDNLAIVDIFETYHKKLSCTYLVYSYTLKFNSPIILFLHVLRVPNPKGGLIWFDLINVYPHQDINMLITDLPINQIICSGWLDGIYSERCIPMMHFAS